LPLEELEELLDELELDVLDEEEPELELEEPPHADNEMRQIERTSPETRRKNFFGIDTPFHTLCS
jgi:hypothetical protein